MTLDIEKIRPAFQKAVEKQQLFHGWDWHELSDEETAVFEIDPDRWPMMLTAYDCFSGLTGASHNDWYEPGSGKFDPEKFNVQDFMAFGKELGLTRREAFTVWRKVEWWKVRNGVMLFKDEQEPAKQVPAASPKPSRN